MVRAASRASIAIVVALAPGCSAGEVEHDGAAGSHRRDNVVTRRVRAKADGCEHELGIRWEPSLDAAMERGRREKKPVLVAFSARRQDDDFASEF